MIFPARPNFPSANEIVEVERLAGPVIKIFSARPSVASCVS
jgi:hypothetical protein